METKMRYAQINNNIVVNIITWDGTSPYPNADLVLITGHCGLGWSYVNGQFCPPLDELGNPEE
jgi:hypothetical protein